MRYIPIISLALASLLCTVGIVNAENSAEDHPLALVIGGDAYVGSVNAAIAGKLRRLTFSGEVRSIAWYSRKQLAVLSCSEGEGPDAYHGIHTVDISTTKVTRLTTDVAFNTTIVSGPGCLVYARQHEGKRMLDWVMWRGGKRGSSPDMILVVRC